MNTDLIVDKPIIWEIYDNTVYIMNIGTMDNWKPSNMYVDIGQGIYRHYLKSNAYLASLDNFIKINHLDGLWYIEREGYFPTDFINIFDVLGANARDMNQIIKGLDMAYRRGTKLFFIKSLICTIDRQMMKAVIMFGDNNMGIIRVSRVIEA